MLLQLSPINCIDFSAANDGLSKVGEFKIGLKSTVEIIFDSLGGDIVLVLKYRRLFCLIDEQVERTNNIMFIR